MILWQDKNHHFFNQSINAMREGGVGKAHFSSVSYHFDKFLGALLHKKADISTPWEGRKTKAGGMKFEKDSSMYAFKDHRYV